MNSKNGTLLKDKDGYKVTFQRELNHPVEDVWDAITDPEKLRIWFTKIEMERQAGSSMKFHFDDGTTSSGKIVRMVPPRLFEWTWENELAKWELEDLNGRCRLTFTYSRINDEYAISVPAGFHTVLNHLETFLAGRTEPYPFGSNDGDEETRKLKEVYRKTAIEKFPELEAIQPVVIEKLYNAPASALWSALTDKDEMKKWYFDVPDFKPEIGCEFSFVGGEPGGKQWLHLCKVTDAKPESIIAYTWRYEGAEGESHVKFELFPQGSKTLLRLTHTGLHTFPKTEPDLAKKNFVMGWNMFIEEFEKYLASGRVTN